MKVMFSTPTQLFVMISARGLEYKVNGILPRAKPLTVTLILNTDITNPTPSYPKN